MSEYVKVEIYTDDDGHDYIVPEYAWEEFFALTTKIDEADSYSDEWYDLIDQFIESYGKYQEYPHNVDLYMLKEEVDKWEK